MKRLLISVVAILAALTASAQISLGEKGGVISGSIESNNIVYFNDKALSTPAPDTHFGSNDYIKVDYAIDRFSAGIQVETYLPALQGYEIGNYGLGKMHDFKVLIPQVYAQWQDKSYSVTVGNIFDQFGNGLIFRTFEDRQLGFNNGMLGLRATANIGDYVAIKALYGRPRLYTSYKTGWAGGADLSLSLGDMFGFKQGALFVEGSYTNRYEKIGATTAQNLLNMYSARVNFDMAGFTLRGEYVGKGKDFTTSTEGHKGQAVYGEVGYANGGFSFTAMGRMLDRMVTPLTIDGAGTGNTLNYLPALTRQYTYMLANLNPYQVNAEGELGGQADFYYSYRSKSNRYRYWNFHLNYSTYYTLRKSQAKSGNHELLWQDINFDVERQWSKKLKTTFLYSFQEWNPYHGYHHRTYVSNIFVADVQYKFDRKKSLRVEAQYLLSGEYEGDWVAGLVEFNLAPRWSFFVSDMYNHGRTDRNGIYKGTKKNYYSVGGSYTIKRTRIQLSYGRNRAGFICSGGVCRYSPEYNGINIAVTSSF
ncbi:MAG: hypothetical protein IJO90_08700 [Alistipes sp.]|nr:hypothetical protein [Alistipes sp.]